MDPVSSILSSQIVSQACNAITLTDATLKLGRNVSRTRFWFNNCRPALKIAVFGSSGSGKSSFLGMLNKNQYDGSSTRSLDIVKFTLPNGRRIHFYDCPGQVSYRSERNAVKTDILKGKFHAIINVVCFGYNETDQMSVKVFDDKGNIRPEFLETNRKIELDHLKEWIYDIDAKSKIKWILTLINKEDIWSCDTEIVHAYYKEGEYAQIIKEMSKPCPFHILSCCSKISLFGGKPMLIQFSDREKKLRYYELLHHISQFIKSN